MWQLWDTSWHTSTIELPVQCAQYVRWICIKTMFHLTISVNVLMVSIFIQVVTHLLLPWFELGILVQSRIPEKHEFVWKWNVIAHSCQKGVELDELWKYSCIMGYPWAAFMYCSMNSCLIGTLSIYTQKVPQLRSQLNQPSSFCSAPLIHTHTTNFSSRCVIIIKTR